MKSFIKAQTGLVRKMKSEGMNHDDILKFMEITNLICLLAEEEENKDFLLDICKLIEEKKEKLNGIQK